ncbi:hypothetical protein J6590_051516 [Homalodisca vitripennis]|nr:hypothetical protein J6590_051516 [Homalodisca vitripennis]
MKKVESCRYFEVLETERTWRARDARDLILTNTGCPTERSDSSCRPDTAIDGSREVDSSHTFVSVTNLFHRTANQKGNNSQRDLTVCVTNTTSRPTSP